jgi:hypothetical protein
MRLLPTAAGVPVLVLALATCGTSRPGRLTQDAREDVIVASSRLPVVMTSTETLIEGGTRTTTTVVLQKEDDYRYAAVVSKDGRPAYEVVTHDDHRLVKVDDATAIPPLPGELASALPVGSWIEDGAGPPGEFGSASDAPRAIDVDTVARLLRVFDESATRGHDRTLVDVARGALPWDPKSALYLKANDKFPAHRADGVRYDLVPPPYEGRNVFSTSDVPADLTDRLRDVFLFESLWFEDGRLTRVERALTIDRRAVARDLEAMQRLARQRAGRGTADTPLPAVALPPDVRQTIVFEYPSTPPITPLPAAVATVDLRLVRPPAATEEGSIR